MSNILYIGPYREFSGRGSAARNYIKALVYCGHNVSIRPIYSTFKSYPSFDIDNDILELENNFNKKYHAVIQHCYPHEYYFDNRFDKIIGIVNLESLNYRGRLDDYLSIPDQLIAPSNFVKQAINENKNFNVYIIPEPIDIKKISEYKNNKNHKDKKTSDFIFYVIADFLPKNNIPEVLECFWMAFDENYSVELVIKTKNKIYEFTNLHQTIEYEFAKINPSISRYKKKPRLVIGEVKKEAINYLHNNGDCYIDLSSSRCFGGSVLEALAFDNSCIVHEFTSQSEVVDNTNNFIVESELVNCRDAIKVHDVYNTFDQQWYYPNKDSLIQQLKNAFLETKEQKAQRLLLTQEKIKDYSIETISEQFKYL